jgi:hypothetical protein
VIFALIVVVVFLAVIGAFLLFDSEEEPGN